MTDPRGYPFRVRTDEYPDLQARLPLPFLAAAARHLGRTISIFDIESTTFGGPTFGITECAVLSLLPNGEVTLRLSLVNPENPISPQARLKTGITDEMVRDKPNWGAHWAPEMARIATSDLTMGWNSKRFDVPRVAGQQVRYGFEPLPFPGHIDMYDKVSAKRGSRTGDLAATASALGLTWVGNAHRAAADSIMTGAVADMLVRQHGLGILIEEGPVLLAASSAPPAAAADLTEEDAAVEEPSADQRLVLTNDVLIFAIREAGKYDPQSLSARFRIPIRDLEYRVSDLLRERKDIETALFADDTVQSWLAHEIEPATRLCWNGHRYLKPLMEHLSKDPRADERLTYAQILVALRQAGLR